MKNFKYSPLMKTVVMIMQEIFAVVLVICIVLLNALFHKSMLGVEDIQNRTFVESGYYEEIFHKTVTELFQYIEYKEQFETKGNYNPNKAVNVVAYMDDREDMETEGMLSGSSTHRYYLGDLEEWSRNYSLKPMELEYQLFVTETDGLIQKQALIIDGEVVHESGTDINNVRDMALSLQQAFLEEIQYVFDTYYDADNYQNQAHESEDSVFMEVEEDETELQDGVSVGEDEVEISIADMTEEERSAQTIERIENGHLFDLEEKELIEILSELNLLNMGATDVGSVIEETYMNVSGNTILKDFQAGKLSVEEMQLAYDSLKYTLDTIGEEINAYKKLDNRYEKDESNLQFWIYSEESDQWYTNFKETGKKIEFSKIGKKLGSYFYYNKEGNSLETNVSGMEDAYYEQYESLNGGHKNIIFVGMDVHFPYADDYRKAMLEYNQLKPWASISLVAVLVSIFGNLLCFIYLGVVAGRSCETEEARLNWFDRIKTEIFACCLLVACTASVLIFKRLGHLFREGDLFGMMIMAGGITFTIDSVLLIFYLSIVRRIKAGYVWRGSIVYWIGSGIFKVIRNWKPSVKIILFFLCHMAVTLCLGAFVLHFSYERWVVLLGLVAYLMLSGAEAVIFLREGLQRNVILEGIKHIAGGELEYKIDTNVLNGENKVMGSAINTIGEGLYYAVDDSTKNERLKADLITNVSHDIKTPLTSIINYVDLLKREELKDERIRGYIDVLDAKSQRLKHLTEDLVEASKISSGNITLQFNKINLVEMVYQTAGEFNEKFEKRGLTAVTKLPNEPVFVMVDGRRMWRVLENLYNNVAKYALENTRVYVDMEVLNEKALFTIKNVSQHPLNIDASELTERFIRGDVSRSTEGSGLGLSIAKNLTNLMGGRFDIYLDGDLFKVTVAFPLAQEDVE